MKLFTSRVFIAVFLIPFTWVLLSCSQSLPVQEEQPVPVNLFGFEWSEGAPKMLPLQEPSWSEPLQELVGFEGYVPAKQEGRIALLPDPNGPGIEIQDDPNNKEPPPPCKVTGARVLTRGLVHAPLSFPPDYRSPAGGVNPRTIGPVVGLMPTAPPMRHTGHSFEIHGALNAQHGCSSKQFKKSVEFLVDRQNRAGFIVGSVFGAFAVDNYIGTTRSGALRDAAGFVHYEGQPTHLHWHDAPGQQGAPGGIPLTRLLLQYYISALYDSVGNGGYLCFTGQITAVNGRTARPIQAPALRNMVGNLAPGMGTPPAVQRNVNFVRNLLRRGAFNGQSNPNFRTLGCRRLDPIPNQFR